MDKHADIISTWEDLPMGKYEELCELDEDKSLEEIDRQVKKLSILTDAGEDTILSLPIMEYKALVTLASFLSTYPVLDYTKIAKTYSLGGLTLVPVRDIQDVTTAQYKDFQDYLKSMEKNIVPILSCFLLPKGKKYLEDYDVRDVQKAIRDDLSVADALRLYGFFMKRLGISMLSSLTSLEKEKKLTPEMRARMLEKLWGMPS